MTVGIYLLLLFGITLLGGSIPILYRKIDQKKITLLLGFSGAFLLGITCLHLMPESFVELKGKTGVYILLGFFLQLILQRLSHGLEHGHIHDHENAVHTTIPIFIGLAIHAFLEGMPLGFNYQQQSTLPSIFMGVLTHKIPEAITFSLLLVATKYSRKTILWYVLIFAGISPIAGLMAHYYGQKFQLISSLLVYIIPIVIGSFFHISTTILYESGTKHHELSKQKVVVVLLGVGLALITLL